MYPNPPVRMLAPFTLSHFQAFRSCSHVMSNCNATMPVPIKFHTVNKKVLREHKRHTGRRVSRTPSAVLSGRGGTPIWTWTGSPCLDLAGVPPSGPGRVPPPIWAWQGTPSSGPGWGIPWKGPGEKYYGMDIGHPPGVNRQTPVKTVPSHRTTYAGGNGDEQNRSRIYPAHRPL